MALDQAGVGESLQHPGEDSLVRLDIDQAARAGNRQWSGASGNTKP